MHRLLHLVLLPRDICHLCSKTYKVLHWGKKRIPVKTCLDIFTLQKRNLTYVEKELFEKVLILKLVIMFAIVFYFKFQLKNFHQTRLKFRKNGNETD